MCLDQKVEIVERLKFFYYTIHAELCTLWSWTEQKWNDEHRIVWTPEDKDRESSHGFKILGVKTLNATHLCALGKKTSPMKLVSSIWHGPVTYSETGDMFLLVKDWVIIHGSLKELTDAEEQNWVRVILNTQTENKYFPVPDESVNKNLNHTLNW